MKKIHWWLALICLAAGVLLAGCQVDYQSVAVLFVAHGEPETYADGAKTIILPDGSKLGPYGAALRVPANEQNTLWAMLYEEVAEAITYTLGDFNNNGVLHELKPFPLGDVPPFFSWQAFKAGVIEEYNLIGRSPHNATYRDHVSHIELALLNKSIDVHLAFMDAQPLIAEVVHDLCRNQRYDKLVVVPLLLSESTHTEEIRAEVTEWVEKSGRDMEVVWGHPFFVEPYVRDLHAQAVAGMVEWVRSKLPPGVTDDQIGVVLAAHGDPFPPPYPEFGYKPGDIYSYVYLMEKDFNDAVAKLVPYPTIMGINEFRPPSVDSGIKDFENAGKRHIIVIPTNFTSTSMHTMMDIAETAVGRPVLPQEEVASAVRPSGATVWYTPLGYADREPGRTSLREGMRFCAGVALLELFEKHKAEYDYLFHDGAPNGNGHGK